MAASSDPQHTIEELAEQYLTRLQAGEAVDRSKTLAEHPELGSSLDRRLALVEKVFRAARNLSATPLGLSSESSPRVQSDQTPVQGSGPPPSPGEKTVLAPTMEGGESLSPNEAAIRLRCPHCGNHIQLIAPSTHEVTCVNCGSTFQVDPWGTTSYRPVRLPKRIGKFEVLELLGRGGFGAVYKARDTELDRTVAIKVPRAGYFVNQEDEERFFREARHLARLRHPGIVPIYEIAHERGVPYIVSEYVEGLTLADLLTGSRLSFRESAELLIRVADALDYAHQQKTIHRDIKPGNILIDRAGEPHITDFGLARRDEGEITVTLDGQILGTPAFMSPEQAKGDHPRVDVRSDLYSVGVVMYRMLAGDLPFRGNKRMLLHQVLYDEPRPPRRLNDTIPRDLETICLKAMAKEPARRYPTARALTDDLRRWLAGEPVQARPVSRLEQLWRWCRRNPRVAALSAAIVLILVAAAIGANWAAWRESTLREIAEDARGHEAEQRGIAQANATESNRRLVRLHTHQGIERLELNDLVGSLVWFAAAIGLEDGTLERERPHRVRLGTVLRHCPKITQICFHDAPVTHAEFSPDGRYVATASEDGTARVWDLVTGQGRPVTIEHAAGVHLAIFSPDGRHLATASDDRTVRLSDPATGRLIFPPLEHDHSVRYMKFSPDGSRIATSSGSTVRMWNASDGAPITTPLTHPSGVTALAFSPDGTQLASACGATGAGETRVWKVETGELVGTVRKGTDCVWTVAFSPDGKMLVTAGNDSTATVWNAQTLKPIHMALVHDSPVKSASFSDDSSFIVTASDDSTVRIWSARTGTAITHPLRHDAAVRHAVFSADTRYVVSASRDGKAHIWDTTTGELAGPLLRHGEYLTDVAFSRDGRYVVTASGDWTARVWDLAAGSEPIPALPHDHVVRRAMFDPSGRHVATASSDGTIKFWDPATGEQTGSPLQHPLAILDASYSPDGGLFATACEDGAARLWESQTHTLSIAPLLHNGPVHRVAFSQDGTMLLTASEDGTARVWNVNDGQSKMTFRVGSPVITAAFDNFRRRVVTVSEDSSVRLWDIGTGKPIGSVMRHEGNMRSVSFSPDYKYLATAGGDRTARVWDANMGEPVAALKHPNSVLSAKFLPESGRLITMADNGIARVWEVPGAKLALVPLHHSFPVIAHAAISRGETFLVTSAGDRPFGPVPAVRRGEARMWDLETGTLLAPPMRHNDRVIHASIDPESRLVATASYDHTGRIWDISPDDRPVQDLALLAQLLSAHGIDEVGGFVPLERKLIQDRWNSLKTSYPASFTCSSVEVAAWHRREIERCVRSRHWRAAIDHFEQLSTIRPNDLRLYRQRAQAWAELGEWQRAVADFTKAVEAEPDDPSLACDHALATLGSGDVPGYKSVCNRAIIRFGDHPNFTNTTLLVRACTLLPDTLTDWTTAIGLAQSAAGKGTGDYFVLNRFQNALGAALYRSGLFEDAAKKLTEATEATQSGGTAADWLLLAMALHETGRNDNARTWFNKAAEWMDEPPENRPHIVTLWQDRLVWQQLRSEAEERMRSK
jgi:WD40 repeat protein/Flp pilus assembly protein TadD/ribosomal protein S27E